MRVQGAGGGFIGGVARLCPLRHGTGYTPGRIWGTHQACCGAVPPGQHLTPGCTAPYPQTECTVVQLPNLSPNISYCTVSPIPIRVVQPTPVPNRLYCPPRGGQYNLLVTGNQQVVLLTVSPKRQKRGIFLPTTPLMTGPLWAPTRRDTWPPRGSHMLDVAHSAALAKSMTCGHSQGALEGEGEHD